MLIFQAISGSLNTRNKRQRKISEKLTVHPFSINVGFHVLQECIITKKKKKNYFKVRMKDLVI